MKRLALCGMLLFAFVISCISLPALAQGMVIVSRHGEKATTPANDPPLTEAGKKRAELLASMLVDSGVDAIYVTELQRTQQTAAPLASRIHIKPTIIPADDTGKLIDAIRARKSGVVVVIGHSNKLPQIIAGLGGPAIVIPDTEYNNLYVLTVETTKSLLLLLQLHYGDSTPVPAQSGSTDRMTPRP